MIDVNFHQALQREPTGVEGGQAQTEELSIAATAGRLRRGDKLACHTFVRCHRGACLMLYDVGLRVALCDPPASSLRKIL